jgi:hypothetical protein
MNLLEIGGAENWTNTWEATSAFLDCELPNFIEERRGNIASFPAL